MIYLDNASTTKMYDDVRKVMLATGFGNPSSNHAVGFEAQRNLEHAREQVAKAINAEPDEIIFTSGGSEANNMAVKVALTLFGDDESCLVSSNTEHDSMLRAMIHQLPNDKNTLQLLAYMKEKDLINLLREKMKSPFNPYKNTAFSFMYVNNELGFINPVEEICKLAKEYGCVSIVDAVQALGDQEIDVRKIGCDMMTFSSHKIHGPMGVGALYINMELEVIASYAEG